MPGFSNNDIEYSGEGAINHTASQVKKMRMAGVKVLSYFITEGYYGQRMDNFKKMYGKSSEEIDVTSLIPLTRTLNKLFE
jgi:dethiobiotin synthetase